MVMNVLVVDNGTSYLPELTALLHGAKLTTISFEELTGHTFDDYDLIVLSGGHKFAIMGHRRKYARELKLIRESTQPIIGICLGMELIVVAYGGTLRLLRKRVHRTVEIRVTRDDPIAATGKLFEVFESHRRSVKKLPPSLVALAHSNQGIEIIRHKERPVYGFQFHPEMTKSNNIFKQTIGHIARALQ
jgi:GMP synthase-like glutamine amidotransferase